MRGVWRKPSGFDSRSRHQSILGSEEVKMARYCNVCGAKLSIFKKDNLCDSCKHKLEQSIIRTRELTQEQYKILSDFSKNKSSKVSFFNKIYKQLEKIGGIQETEIDLLQKIQEALNLTNEAVSYTHLTLPTKA